jgi:hypothetical protein
VSSRNQIAACKGHEVTLDPHRFPPTVHCSCGWTVNGIADRSLARLAAFRHVSDQRRTQEGGR